MRRTGEGRRQTGVVLKNRSQNQSANWGLRGKGHAESQGGGRQGTEKGKRGKACVKGRGRGGRSIIVFRCLYLKFARGEGRIIKGGTEGEEEEGLGGKLEPR